MKAITTFLATFGIVLTLLGLGVWYMLGPVSHGDAPAEVFVVPDNDYTFSLSHALFTHHLIRNEAAFWWYDFLLGPPGDVVPGGYRLSGSMDARTLLAILHAKPQLVWVDIRAGIRKEQVGEILSASLGWDESQQRAWEHYTNLHPELEGRFLSGTYLLPRDEPATTSAAILLAAFDEKIQPLLPQIRTRQTTLNTVLTIASLIQREAAGSHDMALISGIIWNRIHTGMRLDIDATLQYIKGNAEDGWWQRVHAEDKFLDSPYNTYRIPGLPPYPIASPGLPAIQAALNPETTDCIFYLHDAARQIHCSATYKEHVRMIEKYLL